MIAVSIPAAEPPARSPERPHTVFRVEVLCNGRRHTVTKRYSEFQALHKRIKKTCKVPDFPRHVPNWMPKVLEQRRQGLELYLQGVLCQNEELPQDILDFLKVRRCQQDPKASSPPSTRLLPSQRPIVGFRSDPFVRPRGTGEEQGPGAALQNLQRLFWALQRCFSFSGAQGGTSYYSTHFLTELLPNTILSGVLQGLYHPLSWVPSQAAS